MIVIRKGGTVTMMKKAGLIIIGGIAAIIALANVGPLISLVICLAILYYSFKQLLKSDNTGAKITWAIIVLVALMASVSHVPAILGLVAAYIVYLVYKKWNGDQKTVSEESSDPFTNFDKQWANLKK